jgi:non-canonical (house-cleaning) NTP pyrophosphatase
LNRLKFIKEKYPEADYWITIEGGVIKLPGSMVEIGSVLVSKNGYDRNFHTEVSRFELPTLLAREIRDGMEAGPAADKVFGKSNIKQEGGIPGEVTDQCVTRLKITLIAAKIAFFQLKNNHLYPDRN